MLNCISLVFSLIALIQCFNLVSGATDQGYSEKIACEKETLNLVCKEGQEIRIKLANYGRFTQRECNPQNKVFHNTHCSWAGTVRVMEKLCNGNRHCEAVASNHNFTDTCPDTFKYLVVQWYCDKAEITTTKEPVLKPEVPVTVPQIEVDRPTIGPVHPLPQNRAEDIEDVVGSKGDKREWCSSIVHRDITWPETLVDHASRKPCPNQPLYFAEYKCGLEGEWIGEPDLHRCVSSWMERLTDQSMQVKSHVEAIKVLRDLVDESNRNSMFGGDLVASSGILNDVVGQADRLILGRPTEERHWTAQQISQYTVEMGSRMLNTDQRTAWADLPLNEQQRTAVAILRVLDNNAELMANNMQPAGDNKPRLSHNIQLEVSLVQVHDYVKFPARSLYDPDIDNILIPREALIGRDATIGTSKVSFTSVLNVGQYLRPSDREVKGEDGSNVRVRREVVSNIIGATVHEHAPVMDLIQPVFILFDTTHDPTTHSNAECVFWDERLGNVGDWSNEGCMQSFTNKSHTSCACNHLTHFAVLMDIQGVILPWHHEIGLSFVTYIGCVISIIALVVSLFTLNLIRDPADRITIQKHLCFCLLVAEILFIFGIRQMGHKLICSLIAGALHYFFLAAFAWMFLEGVHLYRMLTDIFNAELSRRFWYYAFGYGVPAIIVGLTAGIGYENYGTSRYCWLRTDNWAILAFVIPVLVVLFVNLIFLVIAMAIMFRHASFKNGYRHCQHKSTSHNIGSWLKGALGLVCLLGLTWLFGVAFIIDPTQIYFMYIFSALNSLQGLFIFIFYVLCNENVNRAYKRWLQRTDCLPMCWREQGYEGPTRGHVGLYRDMKGRPAYTDSIESRPSASTPLPGSTDSSNSYTRESVGETRYNSAAQLLLAKAATHNFNTSPYEYAIVGVADDSCGLQEGDMYVPCPNGVGVVYRQSARLPPPCIPPPDPPYYAISLVALDDNSVTYETPSGINTPINGINTPMSPMCAPIQSRLL